MEDTDKTVEKAETMVAALVKRQKMLLALTIEIRELENMKNSPSVHISAYQGGVALLAADVKSLIDAELKHRKTTLAEAVKEIEGKNDG